MAELIDLLQYCYDQIGLVDEPMDIRFACTLDVHCTYMARQILTAFDDEKVMSFREGVKWLPAKNTEVLFITLVGQELFTDRPAPYPLQGAWVESGDLREGVQE